ncbi:MAG: ferritin-like domain-containing protein [Kofleriaceae bacterium]
MDFLAALDSDRAERLAQLTGAGRLSLTAEAGMVDAQALLQVALANEVNVAELAALWVATTPELDVRLAFARQSGDEANHFHLVADRLRALGFDVDAYVPPAANALFEYLRGLSSTVERLAAGLYALEAIAYAVNDNFMAFCAARGDAETVRIYREYIQPDERGHHELGRRLLAKYAIDPALQALARATAVRVFELAAATRAKAAERLGAACFPGC